MNKKAKPAKKEIKKKQKNAKRQENKNSNRQDAINRKLEQERKDKRNRLIIFGIVGAVLVLLAGLLIGVLVNKSSGTPSNNSTTDSQHSGLDQLGGISFTKDGVKEPEKGDRVLDFFFDYTCGACVQAEYHFSDTILELVHSGDIDFRLHPVGTHNEVFNEVASGALLEVVRAEPDKAEALHKGLLDHIFDAMNSTEGKSEEEANQLFSFFRSQDEAEKVVKDIAKKVGVSDNVIASFDYDKAKSEIESRTSAWSQWCQDTGAKAATPQMFLDGKEVEIFVGEGENARYLTPEEFKKMLLK